MTSLFIVNIKFKWGYIDQIVSLPHLAGTYSLTILFNKSFCSFVAQLQGFSQRG